MFRIYADRYDYGNRVSLTFLDEHPDGRRVAPPINASMVEIGDELIKDPSVTLHTEQAQELMDQLWKLGLRPTDAANVDSTRSAMQAHIADLRHVVDHLLPKKAS